MKQLTAGEEHWLFKVEALPGERDYPACQPRPRPVRPPRGDDTLAAA